MMILTPLLSNLNTEETNQLEENGRRGKIEFDQRR